ENPIAAGADRAAVDDRTADGAAVHRDAGPGADGADVGNAAGKGRDRDDAVDRRAADRDAAARYRGDRTLVVDTAGEGRDPLEENTVAIFCGKRAVVLDAAGKDRNAKRVDGVKIRSNRAGIDDAAGAGRAEHRNVVHENAESSAR